MNEYEAKQEERRQRYVIRASKAVEVSDAAFKRARALLPDNGQPILVGHHSEKRHRNAIKKADNAMRRGSEEFEKSKHYERKAAGVGRAGISSDDPEAVDKLRTQADEAEKLQQTMRAVNRIIRGKPKNEPTPAKIAAIVELGHCGEYAVKLFEPDAIGRRGFADYQLTNNNANLRRIRKRIATLEAAAQDEHKETSFDGFDLIENPEENRIQFIFPGKPDEATRTLLKSHGFRWARTVGAWQRHLNNAGRHAASCVSGKLMEEVET